LCLPNFLNITKVSGITLAEAAKKMSPEDQDTLVKNLATIEAQLTSVGISGIGCLFQDSDGKFSVGEHVHRLFNEDRTPNLGPWSSAKEFITAGIHRELKQLEDPEKWKESRKEFLAEGIIPADFDLMKRFYNMLLELVNSSVIPPSPSGILHMDWDGLNILVDELDHTKVTGVIDWDFATVRPIWMSYNWEYSVFRQLSFDGSRFEDFYRIRNAAFNKLAPEAYSSQNSQEHIDYLAQISWFGRLTASEAFVAKARVLADMWPQGNLGYAAIQDFLRLYNI
jgi:hypothetical protein